MCVCPNFCNPPIPNSYAAVAAGDHQAGVDGALWIASNNYHAIRCRGARRARQARHGARRERSGLGGAVRRRRPQEAG
eukprot:5366762-Prymnesium_polylepis.1